MEVESKLMKIKDIIELIRDKVLYANLEYQRGEVWSINQKKKLIDSILRGYPLPLIYLHFKKKIVAEHEIIKYETIDGQQRINAIHEFYTNKFDLFDFA